MSREDFYYNDLVRHKNSLHWNDHRALWNLINLTKLQPILLTDLDDSTQRIRVYAIKFKLHLYIARYPR